MDWDKLLADAGGQAVWRLSGPAGDALGAEAAARELGFFTARIDGAAAQDKRALLGQLAERLRFPDYFGGNWDALADCLRDLDEWTGALAFLIVFEDAGKICRSDPEDAGALLDVLESAARFWRGRARPFKAVFSADRLSPS